MATHRIEEESLIGLANSVRAVTGASDTMSPLQMKNALDNFQSKKTTTVTINFSGGYVWYLDESGTLIEIENSGTYELLGGLLYYYPSDSVVVVDSATYNTAIFTDNAADTVYLLSILDDGGTATITES